MQKREESGTEYWIQGSILSRIQSNYKVDWSAGDSLGKSLGSEEYQVQEQIFANIWNALKQEDQNGPLRSQIRG